MAKLSDSEILSAIDAKAKESYGYESGTLSAEREQALNYYLGKPYGNEVEGRSQVVTRDVLETVEWMLPDLLKIFTSGDKVVEFQPVSEEDVEQADQETDYVNHVAMQQNDSFMMLYAWFKDALLLKNGYVKVYWDTSEDVVEDRYDNLAPEQLQMLMQDGAEIVDAEQTDLGINVTLKRVNKVGKVCIEAVPAEEMLIDMACRSLDLGKAGYVEHRTRKTLSEIRLMGLDVDDDIARYSDDAIDDEVSTARDLYEEDDVDMEGADPSTRKVWFRDVTMRIDADGDGIAELMRYYIVGGQFLYSDKAENIYYAALGAVPMPHRHVGLSVADLVMDIQLLRSTIMRQYLDGLFLANNGRYAIDSNKVNLDDMLTSRPGGLVRTNGDPAGTIMPLVHPNTGSFAIEGLNYLDSQKEVRTGITKNAQGMNADQLHKTMGGLAAITSQANMRKELIARIFAETGVKRLYTLVHELLKKHADNQLIYKLRNKWVPVDPRQWKTRTDMTIAVGLGTGNKDMQLQHIMAIMGVQEKAMMIGITDAKKIYNAAKRMAENAGFSDGDEFFTDPSTLPPKPQQPPQPDPAVQVEMIRQQGKEKELAQKAQAEAQQAQFNMQQEIARSTNDIAIEREKINAQMELERYKAQLKAETDLRIAEMQAAMRSQIPITMPQQVGG